MGIWGAEDAVKNAAGKAARKEARDQAVNQSEAARKAGRGRRSIGGAAVTRSRPSRKF